METDLKEKALEIVITQTKMLVEDLINKEDKVKLPTQFASTLREKELSK